MMFILRVPLVRLTVGADKYSWEATVMTSYTLAFYAISLVAQSLIIILARAFYALCDTKTPVLVTLVSILFNAFLAIFFVRELSLGVWSIALAYTIGSLINFVLLFILLIKRIGGIDVPEFLKPVNRMGISAFITGVALYIPYRALDTLIFDTTKTFWLIILTAIVSTIGFITYIFFAWLLKIDELKLVWSSLGKVKRRLFA